MKHVTHEVHIAVVKIVIIEPTIEVLRWLQVHGQVHSVQKKLWQMTSGVTKKTYLTFKMISVHDLRT